MKPKPTPLQKCCFLEVALEQARDLAGDRFLASGAFADEKQGLQWQCIGS
jgi:hypothetical protein